MDPVAALADWDNFLIAEVGASAALAGLLFVGVSLNLNKILSFAYLPNRALLALFLLLAILVVCSLLLMPGQSSKAIGFEVLLVGAATWLFGTLIEIGTWQNRTKLQNRTTFLFNVLLFEAATVPYIVGGILLLAGNAHGLQWFGVAVILSFTKAVLDAWVLLVEINR